MDALRMTVARTATSFKAAGFRQSAALAAFTATQNTFHAALSDLKSCNNADTKQRADDAASAMKEAAMKLTEAENQLQARADEAEQAKQAFNGHKASRPRRGNARDKYEIAEAPAQSADTAAGALAICPLTVSAFHSASKAALANPTAMTAYPTPPSAPCGNLLCAQGKEDRALDACPCNLRAIFGSLSAKELKAAKNQNLPDRIAKAPAAIRSDCQAKAAEVFAVVDKTLQQSRTDQKKRTPAAKHFHQTSAYYARV